jgi:glutamate--cysteine ligase
MYLFKREGKVYANTGQSFRAFWKDGFQGERPTTTDWKMHLATVFPEVRLKTTLEMRGVDSQPKSTYAALAALWAGLLYDAKALDEAEQLVAPLTHDELLRARGDVAQRSLAASVGAHRVQALAEQVLDLARAGLVRRAKMDASGHDESRYLDGIAALTGQGRSPAHRLLEALPEDPTPDSILVAAGVER